MTKKAKRTQPISNWTKENKPQKEKKVQNTKEIYVYRTKGHYNIITIYIKNKKL